MSSAEVERIAQQQAVKWIAELRAAGLVTVDTLSLAELERVLLTDESSTARRLAYCLISLGHRAMLRAAKKTPIERAS